MPSKTDTAQEIDWSQLIETALTAPGSVGDTYNRFYSYSFTNQMLLLSQGVLEPVATYKRWQDLGRQVVRGAKAKAIVRPISVKREDERGDEVRYTRFKVVRCLFGYSETEGEELPPVEVPAWSLRAALKTLDVKQVPYQLMDGNTQGYSIGREFAVNPVAVHPLKTTFHELGHIVLGHTTEAALEDYEEHRGLREFEAEGTAHLVGKELDVLSDEAASVSRGYIQVWMRDQRPPDVSIRHVFAATDKILRAGRLAVEGGDDA